MRLPIEKQRNIIRCIAQSKNSDRIIAQLNQVSPTTVNKLRKAFVNAQVNWGDLALLPDTQFLKRLGTSYQKNESTKIIPNWETIHQELNYSSDMTLSLLHAEYLLTLENTPESAIGYSHFTDGYRRWLKKQRISMRQFHLPGEKMFIDFCGRTMPIQNPKNGEVQNAQIFVAVLGASGYIFVTAVPSQKISDWVICHIKAFEFFGGSPSQLIPDNLKSAVIKHTHEKIILNRHYMELAEHYSCIVNPARVRKPKDKSMAEISVQIVQRFILSALRKHKFFSYEELNSAILKRLEILNNKVTKVYKLSRYERFMEFDKKSLNALPRLNYEFSRWKYGLRVPVDYHIEFEGSYYSVPYQYIHNKVDLRATNHTIEFFLSGQRIASHLKQDIGKVITLSGHMPSEHLQQHLNEPQELLAWSQRIGEHAYQWVKQNLENRRDFANGLKSARKLRQWVREEQNHSIVDSACQFALKFNRLGFQQLKSIISNNLNLSKQPAVNNSNVNHKNIRGADYYRLSNNKELE